MKKTPLVTMLVLASRQTGIPPAMLVIAAIQHLLVLDRSNHQVIPVP